MPQPNHNLKDAYWLSPAKEIFPVWKHISFISNNLKMFGMSRAKYQAYLISIENLMDLKEKQGLKFCNLL